MDLLGSDSGGDEEEVSFKINQNYAKNYETWRKKEERQKLIDRYGDQDESSSSSSEEEIRSTPQMDKDWLRAYAVVRFKQPRLYKDGEKFFRDEAKPIPKKKEKATTLKDHERKFILEKGGVESDEESKPQQPQGKSYFEEQEEIKKSFKDALADSGDEEDSEDNGLLVKRHKTVEEEQKEENDYLEWLKGEKQDLEDEEAAAELAPLKEYWSNPHLPEKEKVLRDYILNNGYMAEEDSDDSESDLAEGPDFGAEEAFLKEAEKYETKYNFRHEEPGGDEIKSYPRVIETSVRTKDTRRTEQRKKKMEKKKMEREKRNEEIKLLQKLQKEEKREKLELLRNIANNPEFEYDLDADFDPDEHNKVMQKYFNEDYYGDAEDGSKPKFEYDAAIDDEPDDWWGDRLKQGKKGENAAKDSDDDSEGDSNNDDDQETSKVGEDVDKNADDELHADDPNFTMDADYDPNFDYKAEKKRRKKYGKGLAKKLPVFDPATKTFDEYMDEYLKDKIDSLPFTYREVLPNDFGLSTEEILKAPERELNAWVSVKKMSQYCSNQEELAEKRKFSTRARKIEKKLKVLPSLIDKPEEENKEKKKKKKKKKKKPSETGETDSEKASQLASPKNSSKSEVGLDPKSQISEDKQKKRKRKDSDTGSVNSKKQKQTENEPGENLPKKKRKLLENGLIETVDSSKKGEVVAKKLKKKKKDGDTGHDESSKKSKSCEEWNIEPKPKKTLKRSPDIVDKGLQSMVKNGLSNIPKGKKNKLKKKNKEVLDTVSVDNSTDNKATKKKKKKVSIPNFSSKASNKEGARTDNKKIQKQLSKVMSASRLSKYGIGPNSQKNKKKRKKKQQSS